MLYVYHWTYSSHSSVWRPWYSHLIRLWNETQTIYLAWREHAELWPSMPARVWQVMSGNEAGGYNIVWSCGHTLCLKGQLLLRPSQPLLLSNVSLLLLEFPIYQKSGIQTFSETFFNSIKHYYTIQAWWNMLWVRFDTRATSLQILDEDYRG